jgi:hypothetical protein
MELRLLPHSDQYQALQGQDFGLFDSLLYSNESSASGSDHSYVGDFCVTTDDKTVKGKPSNSRITRRGRGKYSRSGCYNCKRRRIKVTNLEGQDMWSTGFNNGQSVFRIPTCVSCLRQVCINLRVSRLVQYQQPGMIATSYY